MPIEEMLISIFSGYAPADRKIELETRCDTVWRQVDCLDETCSGMPAEIVLADMPNHSIDKRVPDRQEFCLWIADRCSAVKCSGLVPLRQTMFLKNLRRQELQEAVLALNLPSFADQEIKGELFQIFQADWASQISLIAVKAVARSISEEARRRDLIRLLRPLHRLPDLFFRLFVKRPLNQRLLINLVRS